MKKSISKINFFTEYHSFILKTLIMCLIIGILYFLYSILSILSILFFALFLNILFSPFLNKLNKYKIPDWLGIIIIYLFLLLFLVIVFFAIVPIFIQQTALLASNISFWLTNLKEAYGQNGINSLGLPIFITEYLKGFLTQIDFNYLIDTLKNNFSTISGFLTNNFKDFLVNGAGVVFSITNIIGSIFFVFLFAFFIALERKDIRLFFYKIIPDNLSKHILSKEDKIIDSLYLWLKGQMMLSLSIFVLVFLGILIIRLFGVYIEQYFALALIAGMMEFIPYLGPIIALLPALALAAFFGWKAIIIVLVLYIVVQQLENNFLVPYIMSKTLSVSPFATILAVTIGASLFGIIGIILAVPFVAIIHIFLEDQK